MQAGTVKTVEAGPYRDTRHADNHGVRMLGIHFDVSKDESVEELGARQIC